MPPWHFPPTDWTTPSTAIPSPSTTTFRSDWTYKSAIRQAQYAYEDAKNMPPGYFGPTPAQAARQAFLNTLRQG